MNQKEEREMIEKAIKKYNGQINTLNGAIGAYFTGQKYGWKVMYLAHDKKTIRKYEGILDINFRKEFPEEGIYSKRSVAYQAAKKVSNFWKAVKGEIPGIRSAEIK